MKTNKLIYWISTSFIFLFDSVMPALTSQTELAVEGIRHLGFPDYFRVQLTIFKVLGGFILMIPQVPARFKEWAYVGFAINFISACIGHAVVDGMDFQTFFPLIILTILIVSYIFYNKINESDSFELQKAHY
jgi:hypothetical protein